MPGPISRQRASLNSLASFDRRKGTWKTDRTRTRPIARPWIDGRGRGTECPRVSGGDWINRYAVGGRSSAKPRNSCRATRGWFLQISLVFRQAVIARKGRPKVLRPNPASRRKPRDRLDFRFEKKCGLFPGPDESLWTYNAKRGEIRRRCFDADRFSSPTGHFFSIEEDGYQQLPFLDATREPACLF